MMKYKKPDRQEWLRILQRPENDSQQLFETVKTISLDIKRNGDKAVQKYTSVFDGVDLKSVQVTNDEFENAEIEVSTEIKKAIEIAEQNIRKFHNSQLQETKTIETINGVECYQRQIAIENVGLYIPGGSAPLISTVLMLAVPAKIAGCKNIVACTPPKKDGSIDSTILYTLRKMGVQDVYKCGGIQSVAAMAYGTESIKKVDKIFGPGNKYVTAAKQWVSLGNTAIDMPAGPSEVLVIADDKANPKFIAADLLSQLEHDSLSQAILATDSNKILQQVSEELDLQRAKLLRQNILSKSISNCKLILLRNLKECIALSNQYAPEHLIIQAENAKELSEQVENAGSVFIGAFTPESAGDYASGTNHTLPTAGFAKNYSGLSTDSFMKKITYQEISKEGLANLAKTIITLADAEGLDAHKKAVEIRLAKQ